MSLRLNQELLQRFSLQQVQVSYLLSLPCLLLDEKIQQEIDENPALEEENVEPLAENLEFLEPQTEEKVAALDEYLPEDEDYQPFFEEENDFSEDFSYQKPEQNSVYEKILAQLSFELQDEQEKILAETLVGNLDENGYLVRDLQAILDDLLFYQDVEIQPQKAEKILKLLQHLEPLGLGTKNLQDCLMLQLRAQKQDFLTEQATEMLNLHFDLFMQQKFEKIREKMKISKENWQKILEKISTLHPKPAKLLEANFDKSETIIPDFLVRINEFDALEWSLNPRFSKNLQLSESFKTLAKQPEQKEFIQKKVQNAQNFLQALDLRKKMLKIGFTWLLEHQKNYFLSGENQDLQPLTLKNMAESLGIDISTASRIVQDKYAQTPFGIIALKKLFNEKLQTEKGSVSVAFVKEKIKFLIEKNQEKPLTDEKITQILQEEGVQISRRTVNKYRKEIQPFS